MEENFEQIDGVIVKKLKVISDERGHLMEIIRDDEEIFSEFGQTYLTTAYPGVIKAWHYHKLQDDNFCVIKGMARVALNDAREGSPTCGKTMEFIIGEKNPCVIHIPSGVLHGYKAIGTEMCYLLNLVTRAYNHSKPDEFRVDYKNNAIGYDWENDINE